MEIGVAEAALQLGVSEHEVRRLVRAGQLAVRRVGTALLIDTEAVQLRMRIRPSRGRALAPEMAWAVLWVLDGRNPTWLDSVHRSRARAWVRAHRHDKIENLASALRSRSQTEWLRALPLHLEQIRAEEGVFRSGVEVLGRAQLRTGGEAELYCDVQTRNRLVKRYGLGQSADANLVLHISRMPLANLAIAERMPEVVAALDLLEVRDAAGRSTGTKVLKKLLAGKP